jgi:hypothetical protein
MADDDRENGGGDRGGEAPGGAGGPDAGSPGGMGGAGVEGATGHKGPPGGLSPVQSERQDDSDEVGREG